DIRLCKVGICGNGRAAMLLGSHHIVRTKVIKMPCSTPVMIPCIEIICWLSSYPLPLGNRKLRLYRANDRSDDFILDLKDIFGVAVIVLRPELSTDGRIH